MEQICSVLEQFSENFYFFELGALKNSQASTCQNLGAQLPKLVKLHHFSGGRLETDILNSHGITQCFLLYFGPELAKKW